MNKLALVSVQAKGRLMSVFCPSIDGKVSSEVLQTILRHMGLERGET